MEMDFTRMYQKYIGVISLETCYSQRSVKQSDSCLSYRLTPMRHVEPSLLLCGWLSPQLCWKSCLVCRLMWEPPCPPSLASGMWRRSTSKVRFKQCHVCSHSLCMPGCYNMAKARNLIIIRQLIMKVHLLASQAHRLISFLLMPFHYYCLCMAGCTCSW